MAAAAEDTMEEQETELEEQGFQPENQMSLRSACCSQLLPVNAPSSNQVHTRSPKG
jgi:hypothetical protein